MHMVANVCTYINGYAGLLSSCANMSTVRTLLVALDRCASEDSMVAKEFMTLTAAAEALGVSRFKVSRLIRDGELQAFVSPLDRRQRLVRRSDVEALKQQFVPVEIETGKIAA
jgi:excisionase family DNA binding protein